MKRLILPWALVLAVVFMAEAANQLNHEGAPAGLADEPRLLEKTEELLQSAQKGFRSIAELDRSIHNSIWEATPIELRCVLGIMKCIELALVLLGLLSLKAAGRLLS